MRWKKSINFIDKITNQNQDHVQNLDHILVVDENFTKIEDIDQKVDTEAEVTTDIAVTPEEDIPGDIDHDHPIIIVEAVADVDKIEFIS